jgi:23S rRNA pseudouridine1911/1915/1917 synthase
MVVAKRSKAAERLSEQLVNGALRRNYQAIVLGTLNEKRRLKHYLIKNEATNEVRAFDRKKDGAKEAALWVHPLKNFQQGGISLTLVELELETGRSHQIRVQCAVSGFPLVGDQKYGTPAAKNLFYRPALHSSMLSFFHPMSKEPLVYLEEMPTDIRQAFPGPFAETEIRR